MAQPAVRTADARVTTELYHVRWQNTLLDWQRLTALPVIVP